MGMFDSIWAKCPNCGEENEFQTKSGECKLGQYDLENCPEDELADANRHSPIRCDCGDLLKIDTVHRKVVVCGKWGEVY